MNKSEVKGLFLFSSCFSLGLDFVITIRNAPSEDRGPLEFQLNLFLDGNLVYSKDYPPLEYKGFFEIDSNEIEHNLDASKDYLVTIVSNRPQNNKDLIYQEHAITYRNRNSLKSANVLYGHLPLIANKSSYSPIILLAHKCWISSEVDSYVLFANRNNSIKGQGYSKEPLSIAILSEKGEILHSHQEEILLNSTYKFDVKKHLSGKIDLNKNLKFVNVVAKGYDSLYSILVLMKNSKTGNMALEHSLPPLYYSNASDFSKIRAESLENFFK